MRRLRTGLVILTLASLGLLLMPAVAQADPYSGVEPILSCVSYNAATNEVTAYFGYVNLNSSTVVIPYSPFNFIDPPPSVRGQPVVFDAGYYAYGEQLSDAPEYGGNNDRDAEGGVPGSYPIMFNLNDQLSITWNLAGYSVTASNDPALYCAGQAPTTNTTPPTVVGAAAVGSTLATNPGAWGGSPAPTLSYQWQRDSGGGWSDIAGATGVAYSPTAADVGDMLRVQVTGTNPHAVPVVAVSDPTAAVTAGAAPAMTLLLAPAGVSAGGRATVSGVVYSPNGTAVPDAPVFLAASAGMVAASVHTDGSGTYTASFVAPSRPGAVLVTASVPSEGLSASMGVAVAAAGAAAAGEGAGVATSPSTVTAGGSGTLSDLTATAEGGTGAVAVVGYGATDPESGIAPPGHDSFFDAGLSAGSSFQSVTLQDCGLAGPSVAYWWDGSAWQQVAPQGEVGNCLVLGPFQASATSPSVAELAGTPFVVATAGSVAAVAPSAGSGQSATVGATFPTPLAARVTDGSGNPVSGVAVTFTAPATGPGATFTGGSASAVVTTGADGIATAPALTANDAAGSYTVTAAASGEAATLTLANLPGPATQLAFSASPAGAMAGVPFATQPAVRVEDAYGNTVAGDTSAVSVGITSGTGAAGASLGGTATVAAVGGVASFSGLVIDRPGTGYTLTAAAAPLTSAVSAAFAVTAAAPARIALTPSAPTVVPDGVLTVAGAVYDALGNPIAGATVDLTTTGGSVSSPAVTAADGSFSAQYAAPASAGQVTLKAVVAGTAVGTSATVTVTAGGAAALSLDLSASSVAAGGGVTVSGLLQDSHGNPEPGVAVSVTASSGTFTGSGTVSESVSTSVYGAYSATFTAPAAAGPVTVTASVPGQSLSSEAVLAVVASLGQASGASVSFAVSGDTIAGGAGSPTPEASATGSGGSGAVAVVQYGSDPVGGPPPDGAGSFFDAGVSTGSTFQSVTVQDCGLAGPGTAFWWDSGTARWVRVQPQVPAPQPDGTYCLDLGPFAASGTSPTLTALTGTPFAVATSLAAGDTLTWSPSPLAATGSLKAGQSMTVAVYAKDGSGAALPGATVYLSFIAASRGGSASVVGTALAATPQAFATDASGQVRVAYTAPATLPDGGTDTLTAASAASGPAVSATDSYAFATSSSSTGGAPAGGAGGGGAIVLAPVVSGVSPSSGPAAGGTRVTLTGTHLTGATAVAFGGSAAIAFTLDSDSEMTATAPSGTGIVDVTVTTPYGTSATSSADEFSYNVPVSQTAPAAPTFSDVPASYWAYASIEALAGKGIIGGFPDGTFRPDAAVTRAQFVKMLDLTLGLSPGAGATPFTDVPSSAWYAPYVAAAVQAGIVQGMSPTSFGADATLSREEMAVLLARALKLTKTTPLQFADDAQIDPWALAGVQAAVAAGYLDGFPGGTVQPLATATRAQAAKVLAAVLIAGGGGA